MAVLTQALETGAFVWEGTGPEAAAQLDTGLAGWTRTILSAPGRLRYYTADYAGKPAFNPYAALAFADIADARARAVLAPLWDRYHASLALDAADPGGLPDGEALLPFQRAGVRYALEDGHVLITDEMGLGKTVQALAVANLTGARRILILCPASVLLQWRAAVRRFLLPPNSTFLITSAKHGVHPTARVTLISHDRCRGEIGDKLAATPWDLAVMDECHYFRNYSAARTVAVLGSRDQGHKGARPGVIRNAAKIIGLTGTPLPNRPRECYTLARALDWQAVDFMSEDAFQFRFNPSATMTTVNPSGETKTFVIEKTGRLSELQARLRSNFMVRRLKKDAAPQMPEKNYSLVQVSNRGTEEIVKAERLLDIDPDAMEASQVLLDGHIAALRAQMGLAKAPLVVDYVRGLLEGSDDALVVFAWHRPVIMHLLEKLASFRPVVVHGGTSPRQRQEACATFANDPRCRVFIGQLQSAGTGVDGLQTRAWRAVFAEPSWVPGENEQCVDRLHRIGQVWPVQADFLVAPESLDERVIGRAISKIRVAHVALDRRLA